MAAPTPNARSYTLGAPVGGWNTRDPLISMPETDAIVMDNVIPQSSYCASRGGITEFRDLGTGAVHTLCNLSDAAGNEYLVGVCGTDIYNATSAATSIKGGATVTSAVPWQHTTFRNRLFLVNGTDQPLDWTGTGNVNATAWTGSGLTITNLINVSSYKRRLYFVEKDSFKVWYTEAVDNTSGALLSFNPSSIFSLGGKLLYAGPTSFSTNRDGSQELFCLISSQGEIVVYSGDNPLSTTWDLVGHFFVGRAIGNRCAFSVGGDLHVITFDGVIPMSQLLSGVDITNDYQTLSGKIKPTFIKYANDYSTFNSWCGCYHAPGPYAIINVPITNFGNAYQLVFNTVTKAWCRFTGINAHSWATLKTASFAQALYCGHGSNGKIYRLGSGFLGGSDDGTSIYIDVQQAFTWLGNPQVDKIVQLLQQYFYARTSTVSTSGLIALKVGMASDFNYLASASSLPDYLFDVFSLPSSLDISAANNRKIIDVTGDGAQLSIRYAGNLITYAPTVMPTGNVEFRHYGTKVYYNEGSPVA